MEPARILWLLHHYAWMAAKARQNIGRPWAPLADIQAAASAEMAQLYRGMLIEARAQWGAED